MSARKVWGSWLEFLFTGLGLMVGLGNVWRFPYICFKNGGGAFVLVYALFVCLMALPVLFMEMTVAQYSSRGAVKIWECCPLFKGIGYGCMVLITTVTVYYNVIIAWTLYYCALSFSSVLPWTSCDNDWNTKSCYNRLSAETLPLTTNISAVLLNSTFWFSTSTEVSSILYQENATISELRNITLTTQTALTRKTPTEEFWERKVLKLSSGIGELGAVQWPLTLCLLISWIFTFLALFKGIKSSGKVMYVLATVPYLFLLVLFIRGLTLSGSLEGLRYFFLPKWERLSDFTVWTDAAAQAFYSASVGGGVMLTMSSHNKFHNNCYRDAMLLPIMDALTSIFAGCVVFTTLGYMANVSGVDIQDVVKQGPGIAFMVYPEALSSLPLPQLWSVIFFLTLYTVGLDTQINQVQCISTNFLDRFPQLRKKERLVTLSLCILMFISGIIFTTQAGMYILQLLDYYLSIFSALFSCLLETLVLNWIYGSDRLLDDIKVMIGTRPSPLWKIIWKFICPLMIFVMWVFTLTKLRPISYGDNPYPAWAVVIGWIAAVFCILPIPLGIVHTLWEGQGRICDRLKTGLKPTEHWKPAISDEEEEEKTTMRVDETDSGVI